VRDPRTIESRARTVLAALTAIALGACATSRVEPPPFVGPAVALETTHFPGTPLSGPVPTADVPDALDAVAVRVVALETLPDDLLGLASVDTDLIVAPPDAETLLPAGRLSRNARYSHRPADRAELLSRLERGDLGRTVELGSARGAVGAGTTVRFAITATEERLHPERPEIVRPRLTVLVRGEEGSVAAGPIRLALVLDGLVAEEAAPAEATALVEDAGDAEPPAAPRRVVREETLVLGSEPGEDGHRITLVVPTPFDPAGGAAIAVLLDVSPPPPDGAPGADAHREAAERGRREIADAAARARTERQHGVPPGAVWPGLGESLGTGEAPPPRRTLAFLARTTGAPFTEDVALAAPADLIRTLGQGVFDALRDAATWPEPDALAWLLERETYRRILAETLGEGASPSLEALLVRHLGEVGRHASLVEELIAGSDDRETFVAHVREENLIFLEDNAPAARLRAFDWLTLRGLAPEGYRPLAPRKERQRALREAIEQVGGGPR
jgi:hypothetical protein